MKKTLKGPNGIRIELDSSEIYPDDPGQGTPAIVYRGKHSATYECALDTGELDFGDYSLSNVQMDWLDDQWEKVDEFISTHD